jgi:hypothetical protein
VNRYNQAGGAIMEDLDNDGLLDLAVSSFDPTQPLSIYRNTGKGVFEDRSKTAGVSSQLGGLYCVQTDYNNDGFMDIYIPRGAWLESPIRPSLLRNNKDGTFSDVTSRCGLLEPTNSISASWADYDNDGWLDLFVCCERQPNLLYHNRGDGTFENVSTQAGLDLSPVTYCCKGSAWIDYNNDDYPDLFLNNLQGHAQLYRNNRDGTFTDVTGQMRIDGPTFGFSCWAWDYDNDGWLDLFATCYDRTLGDVVKGLLGSVPWQQFQPAFQKPGWSEIRRQDQGSWPGPRLLHHGEQLRRLRQRWLPGHVPGHWRAEHGHAHPEPNVQERCGQTLRGDHRKLWDGPLAKRTRRGLRRLGP